MLASPVCASTRWTPATCVWLLASAWSEAVLDRGNQRKRPGPGRELSLSERSPRPAAHPITTMFSRASEAGRTGSTSTFSRQTWATTPSAEIRTPSSTSG
jgi:hypothetical protein